VDLGLIYKCEVKATGPDERIVYVPYVRPGFPLARSVMQLAAGLPEAAEGMALAHHGLVIWGDDAPTVYGRLVQTISQAEAYLQERKTTVAVTVTAKEDSDRIHQRAALLMPVLRGALSRSERFSCPTMRSSSMTGKPRSAVSINSRAASVMLVAASMVRTSVCMYSATRPPHSS